ncbi:MAG TPA: penicillin-binding protein activator LpoB [Candidatus Polarisedimenticolia bacterium]|nr:penicillin-binding protein activator LpoB [Candidatus Polarisedimenticolia bacterium]
MRPRVVGALVLLAMAEAGCARRVTTFVDPRADFSLIRRVAVLPLENLTGEPTAAERVRQILIIEMLSSGAVEVVDVGEVARGLRAANVANAVSPEADEIKRLAAELKIQAVMAGTVQEFTQGRAAGAQTTAVSLAFRMIETDAGQVIWSSNVSRSGVGAMSRLFGVGGESATDRARDLIGKALDTLIR